MPPAADARRAQAVVLGLLASWAALLVTGRGGAAECTPDSGVSTCLDADNLWWSAGGARFTSIAAATTPRRGSLAFAALVGYLDRPVLLSAPSPDPEG
ncbi:MAG: hypothetical protein IT377_32520 [Polyangiaceae bacterium]|nr:hypothetical protein [Polyangiaceae bacterium]